MSRRTGQGWAVDKLVADMPADAVGFYGYLNPWIGCVVLRCVYCDWEQVLASDELERIHTLPEHLASHAAETGW